MTCRLVAIVGQTASGKTDLALELAGRFRGEIICGDSRQFYRGMDIGTAKPTAVQRAEIPHHLFDIADPGETVGLAVYLRLAGEALAGVWSRGNVPFLVGGTGQYTWALLEGWEVPGAEPDEAWRREMAQRTAAEGADALYAELAVADPAAAARIDQRNVRRVIRALEVVRSGARRRSASGRMPPAFEWLALAIDVPRDELYRRIDARAEAMFAGGLLDEVRALGPLRGPAASAIGYREAAEVLAGRLSPEEATRRTQYATHRLARSQATWFRRRDARIRWLPPDDLLASAVILCGEFLA